MLEHVNTERIQYIAIAGCAALFLFIIGLIRKRKIREEYSLLWLFMTLVFMLFSFWRDGLAVMSRFVGIAYAPAAFFLLLLVGVFAILIQYSVVISKFSEQNKNLIQEVGLLREEVERLKSLAIKGRED